MAVSVYEHVLYMAQSLSRHEQLRLIHELMELTVTSDPARVMELRRRLAEIDKNVDALLHLSREPSSARDLDDLFEHLRQMPVRDSRSPDEIMGYNANGLPQ